MNSKVFEMIDREAERQANTVELIASENFVSENIKRAMGSCLTNKYAEGKPYARYYGGCQNVDEIESYCQKKWQEVFNTEYHVNVQPHSGANANTAAYMAVLKPNDIVLAMNLDNGGHLTHGSNVNLSGKLFNFQFYDVNENGFIDFTHVAELLRDLQPKLLVAGASAYSRIIDFAKFKELIDTYSPNTLFMVDMAHIAGLVAAEEHPSPFGYADIITTTTHKTLRGPRGGLIFCKPELAKKIDSAVFPGTQGGPLEHIIAAKAICAEEALDPSFKEYIKQVKANCSAMCNEFLRLGYKVVTGGTDNHLFLLDLTSKGLSGKEVQDWLDKFNITLNKNCIPGETRSPMQASGVRIGTAAMTTRGFKEPFFVKVAQFIDIYIRELQKIKNGEDIDENSLEGLLVGDKYRDNWNSTEVADAQ